MAKKDKKVGLQTKEPSRNSETKPIDKENSAANKGENVENARKGTGESTQRNESTTSTVLASLFSSDNKRRFERIEEPQKTTTASEESSEGKAKKELQKKMDKHAEDEFTVFVGNLPTSVIMNPSSIRKQFSAFGEIKTLRFRSISVDSVPISHFDKKTLKKAAVIQNKLNENKKSVNAYIVYKEKESVQRALALNNTEFLGRHIVVDTVSTKKKSRDNSSTLFVGNLPFDTDEEELRSFLEEHIQQKKSMNGASNQEAVIERVRIIRNPDTQKGKGFGYITLKSGVYVPLALLLNGVKYKDRNLRIKSYLSNSEAIEKQKVNDAIRNGRKKLRGKKEHTDRKGKEFKKAVRSIIKKEELEKKDSKKDLKKKDRAAKKEKVGVNMSFMGTKSKVSMNAINAKKRMMKKSKK